MMKKILAFFTMLALLAVPVTAMAAKAGDFELKGFVKLETYWDSSQVNKELSISIPRNNAPQPNEFGRFRMTSQYSRIGLQVHGPEILGAKTKGYIEFDFNSSQDGRQSASNSYIPRLRHAYMELDWPGGWQLLMGQYWDFFNDFEPEAINDSPFQNTGAPSSHRVPQIRLTYKTGQGRGAWTFKGAVLTPYDPNTSTSTFFNGFNNVQGSGDNITGAFGPLVGSGASSSIGALWGQNTAFPQFQGQVIFEKDLYGKAPFKDMLKPFTFEFEAAVQHLTYLRGSLTNSSVTPFTVGQNNYQLLGSGARPLVQKDTQTLTPWIVQATMFIPVLVTHTPNQANTASLLIQAQIGQGFSLVGNGNDVDNSFFKYDSPSFLGIPGTNNFIEVVNYRRHLTPKYGGVIQGQYYFSNEWHVTATYGFDKAFGLGQNQRNFSINPGGPNGTLATSVDPTNIQNYTYASLNDTAIFQGEFQADVFYTPNKNLKFGLGYDFYQTQYFQEVTSGSKSSRFGQNHSVRFGAWYFF
jgi:hypothetical protein